MLPLYGEVVGLMKVVVPVVRSLWSGPLVLQLPHQTLEGGSCDHSEQLHHLPSQLRTAESGPGYQLPLSLMRLPQGQLWQSHIVWVQLCLVYYMSARWPEP